MRSLWEAMATAFDLIWSFDPALIEIVGLSLYISFTALLLSAVIGLPLGALLATKTFPGRQLLIALVNALFGLPAVVVGLLVYLMLSRTGPLGALGLLYTPSAMIIAQAILITPLVTALARQTLLSFWEEYDEQLRSLGLTPVTAIPTLLWEARFALSVVLLAAFGRAIAEVGTVMIVGGNIEHVTRVMTTSIALETSKGNLNLAVALGIVLLLISLSVNLLSQTASSISVRNQGSTA
mgnify:CR=1 FL=1